mgnify:CR=1 FL=1
MESTVSSWPKDKAQLYPLLVRQAASLAEGCPLPLPVLANCAALLWEALDGLNWVGFYLLKGERLYLGPFQGRVACVEIPMGRGVCGTAAATGCAQVVPDVHAFPGHIACDSASRSELVLPLMKGSLLVGVMDLDSPLPGRFDAADAEGLGAVCKVIMACTSWKDGLL